MSISRVNLLNLIAQEVGGNSSPEVARKYLEAIERVILKELKLNQQVQLYNFGTFKIKKIGGYDTVRGNFKEGETKIVFEKPKDKIVFKPFKSLENVINENDYEISYHKKQTNRQRKKYLKEYQKTQKEKKRPTLEESFTNILNDIIS